MKLHELEKNIGATHRRKIVGRGRGSGLGKTSGRGQKGQNSRSGGGVRINFEGGQTQLFRRIPKRGFNNYEFQIKYDVINVGDLNRFADGTLVTPALLNEVGLIKNSRNGIKILADGNLDRKLTIQANKFSKAAKDKIESSGSKIEVI